MFELSGWFDRSLPESFASTADRVVDPQDDCHINSGKRTKSHR